MSEVIEATGCRLHDGDGGGGGGGGSGVGRTKKRPTVEIFKPSLE